MKRKTLSILATLLLIALPLVYVWWYVRTHKEVVPDNSVTGITFGNSGTFPTDTDQMPLDSMYTHPIQGSYVQPEFNLRDTLAWISEHSKIVR